jgi:hypothetical protein
MWRRLLSIPGYSDAFYLMVLLSLTIAVVDAGKYLNIPLMVYFERYFYIQWTIAIRSLEPSPQISIHFSPSSLSIKQKTASRRNQVPGLSHRTGKL